MEDEKGNSKVVVDVGIVGVVFYCCVECLNSKVVVDVGIVTFVGVVFWFYRVRYFCDFLWLERLV